MLFKAVLIAVFGLICVTANPIESSTELPHSFTAKVTLHLPWVITEPPANTTMEKCFNKMVNEENLPVRCLKQMMDKWSINQSTEIKTQEQGRKLMCSFSRDNQLCLQGASLILCDKQEHEDFQNWSTKQLCHLDFCIPVLSNDYFCTHPNRP